VPTPDTAAALAARLLDISALLNVNSVVPGDWTFRQDGFTVARARLIAADLTAAADALAALAAPSPSVAEARFWLEQAIGAVADAQENADYNDPEEASADLAAAKADCAIAIDAYAAAIRADVPPEVREAAGRVMEFVSLAGFVIRGIRVNDRSVDLHPHDLRALARHGLGET
jgi:hypothetical protein